MITVERLSSALGDRYSIKRVLGTGGMATVYLAHDVKHDREVALKVLRPDLGAVVGSQRFLAEIRITARLDHPHILTLIDSGESNGLLWYALPYIRGESLRERITSEKQLGLEEATGIFRQVAGALDYAHKQGVVHRDIKPANILLHEGEAMLVDFGIALAVQEAGGNRLTETGLSLGTPQYMSPEQAAGDRTLDARSDVYSLGAVLYELLTGEPPHTGPSTRAVIAKLMTESPTRLRVLRSAVPESVDAAVMKALSKVPADRWQSVGEFARAVDAGTVSSSRGGRSRAFGLSKVLERKGARPALFAATLLGAAAAMTVAVSSLRSRQSPPPSDAPRARTAIAVLPFQNLSAGESNAYFAGGLHDELLTQLAKVASLTVMGRTSVMPYAGTTRPLGEIAEELAVGSIVEGSVQVMGDRLRVNIKLLDTESGRPVWAEQYNRTLDDAFAIQSDVAQRIVAAVGAALAGSERDAIAAAPTANAEAYRLYLQGQEYLRRPGYMRQNIESMQQLYERALDLEPGFALAHAALAYAHGLMFQFRYDPSPERAASQRAAAETALRLAPDLPEAHLAMGIAHYWGRRDYGRALDEMEIALRGMPNDAALVQLIGAVHRRLGNWEAVDSAFDKAIRLDPRDATLFMDLGGNTYFLTHRYADAVRAYDRALNLAPDLRAAAVVKGITYVLWRGELDTLHATLAAMPREANLGGWGSADMQRARLFLWGRQADSLLALHYRAERSVFDEQRHFLPTSLYAGWAHRMQSDTAAARAAFRSALMVVDSVLRRPGDLRVHAARGLALAGLGRTQEALREARWLQRSPAYRNDAYEGKLVAENRAMILAQAGETNEALDQIELLLAGPSFLSVHTLRLDPRWDPIRQHPRFKALLVKHADPERRG